MSDTTVGDLCILRDEQGQTWSVFICKGGGAREPLGRFSDRPAAAEFALAERQRRMMQGQDVRVHLPDDCPCYRSKC